MLQLAGMYGTIHDSRFDAAFGEINIILEKNRLLLMTADREMVLIIIIILILLYRTGNVGARRYKSQNRLTEYSSFYWKFFRNILKIIFFEMWYQYRYRICMLQ